MNYSGICNTDKINRIYQQKDCSVRRGSHPQAMFEKEVNIDCKKSVSQNILPILWDATEEGSEFTPSVLIFSGINRS